VNDVPGAAREGLHAMAAAPDGTLACVWLDMRGRGTTLYGSFSRDDGATWSRNQLVYRSPDGTICECCHPSAAYDRSGRLHVMWRNALGGARDMYLSTSSDGGKTFSPARKLGKGTWPLDACPMDGGALAVSSDGSVITFWRRGGEMFVCAPGEPERRVGSGEQGWAAWTPAVPRWRGCGAGTAACWRCRPARVAAMRPWSSRVKRTTRWSPRPHPAPGR
jgi:hypothetical protein